MVALASLERPSFEARTRFISDHLTALTDPHSGELQELEAHPPSEFRW